MPDRTAPKIELLRAAYAAFNARNINAALARSTRGTLFSLPNCSRERVRSRVHTLFVSALGCRA